MKNSFRASIVACLVLGVTVVALATPAVDSAVVKPRIWNDAAYSTFTSGNLYPSQVWMNDAGLDNGGWANRHNFRLSANGGISDAVFMNDDAFSFAANVRLTGTAAIEAGLNVSPWWSKDVDGVFMLKTDPGLEEVACWGGRLPFFSFTGSFTDPNTGAGVKYVPGTTVRLGVTYLPHGLSEASPATIQYSYTLIDPDGAGPLVGYSFTSPVLSFDKGNEAEADPYGLWGMLNDARVGGFFMPKVNTTPGNWGRAEFTSMAFTPEPASLALLGLAVLVLRRGR